MYSKEEEGVMSIVRSLKDKLHTSKVTKGGETLTQKSYGSDAILIFKSTNVSQTTMQR